MTTDYPPAPEFSVEQWINTPDPISLASLRGRVVVVEAFQLLCPGCVLHGIPQAIRIARTFDPDEVVTLGMHSVFEHHDAQNRISVLQAFAHEHHVDFPIAMDKQVAGQPIPQTMASYGLQGTPSLILIDRRGRIRMQQLGVVCDIRVGAEIQALVSESAR